MVLLVSAACIGSAKATSTQFFVANGMDDAYEDYFGTFENNSVTVKVAMGEINNSSAGFRFINNIIPKGAKINSATFSVRSTVAGNDLYCQIHAEATGDSLNYSDNPTVLYRPRTTAYTTVGATDIGAGYKYYSVTAVIQEMVYRSDWTTSSAFSILMIGGESGSGLFSYFYSLEAGSTYAANITIDWSPGQTILNQAHYRWRNDDGYELPPSGTVAVDAVRTYSTTGTGKTSSATIAHPVSSGANRLLLVGATLWPNSLYSVTSVTYNGVPLTKITAVTNSSTIQTELWQLVAPATGTANVVVTLSGSTYLTVGVISFTGVDQSTPYGTPATSKGTGTSANITVASASNEMVLSVAGAGIYGRNFTSITGGTQQWNLSAATSTKGAGGTATGAASVTISHGLSASNDWAIIGLAIKPATATFALAEDNKIGIAKSTTKRLRFLVSNTDGISSGAVQYQLKFQETATCTSGTYTAVPTTATDKWQIVDSTYITDAEATLDSTGLTNPVGYSFVAGQLKDAGNTTAGITLDATRFTEMEFSLQARTTATAGGDYCFKLFKSTGAALDTYTNYAQARVLGATAINLLSLEAVDAGEGVRVKWTTAQESREQGVQPVPGRQARRVRLRS